MVKGIDISHYQKVDWAKLKTDFIILKCTESTNFVDPTFKASQTEARKKGLVIGYYHFARGTDAVKEADYFVKNVGEIQTGEFLVLDWEIQHPTTVAWCKDWLKRVNEVAGFRPLIYLNSSTAKSYDWSSIAKDNGLWIANYGNNDGEPHGTPAIGTFQTYVIWQYSSNGTVPGIASRVDVNQLNGDLTMLKKYGKQESVETCKHCLTHCPK